MAKFRRYILTEPAFIAGTLLAVGSRVTSDDLGSFTDPVTKKEVAIKPPASSIEIDENGDALTAEDHATLVELLAGIAPAHQAPISPFNADAAYLPQGAPAQPAGGPMFAAGDLPQAAAPSRRGGRSNSDASAEAAALAAAMQSIAINAAAAGAADAGKEAAGG